MLAEIPRFHRHGHELLASRGPSRSGDDETLGAFLARGRFTDFFVTYFMTPLVAAVWSCDPDRALDYPARYLFAFLEHHGMLTVFGSPTWRTVVGGSRSYVELVAKDLHAVRRSAPVTRGPRARRRRRGHRRHGDTTTYDAVVVATHPDQALAMLAEPDAAAARGARRDPLLAQRRAAAHRRAACCRGAERARASWNYCSRPRRRRAGAGHLRHDPAAAARPSRDAAFPGHPAAAQDLRRPGHRHRDDGRYAHPVYTPEPRWPRSAGCRSSTRDRVAFAGAYHGWGFHEDGARSGRRAAAAARWSSGRPVGEPPAARRRRRASTRTRSGTRGASRSRNTSATAAHTWLVDLDDLPAPPGWLRRRPAFEARDHLGDPDAQPAREHRRASSPTHGVDLRRRPRS